MKLGMIGLGRMGADLVRRLMADGHECVVYDVNADAIATLAGEGASGAKDLADLADQLGEGGEPRAVWIMVPAALVEHVMGELEPLLGENDIVIDGGNSFYRDDIHHSQRLAKSGIHFLDIGTSGGVHGKDRGYCLMIGGENEPVERLTPIFRTIAPGEGVAQATPGRDNTVSTAHEGWLHCGPAGAGHFVKMVHNGIEYGMMAAFAEGMNILHRANAGTEEEQASAEVAPLAQPEYYQYEIDIPEVAEVWRRGSVVASWLLDLTAQALASDPALSAYGGSVSDSGEGRWTVQAAVDEGVPAPVLSAALFSRFDSRGNDLYAGKVLSAMRAGFGGHIERKLPN